MQHERRHYDELEPFETVAAVNKSAGKVAAKKLQKAWVEGMEANTGSKFESFGDSLDTLNGWMEELVKGDTMSFTAIPGKGLEVTVKNETKGVIEDEEFAKAFWAIWLGPEPPNAGLKEGLLGAD